VFGHWPNWLIVIHRGGGSLLIRHLLQKAVPLNRPDIRCTEIVKYNLIASTPIIKPLFFIVEGWPYIRRLNIIPATNVSCIFMKWSRWTMYKNYTEMRKGCDNQGNYFWMLLKKYGVLGWDDENKLSVAATLPTLSLYRIGNVIVYLTSHGPIIFSFRVSLLMLTICEKCRN
jgi:hypothetical protein